MSTVGHLYRVLHAAQPPERYCSDHWLSFSCVITYLLGESSPAVLFLVSAGWKDLPVPDNHPFWLNYNPSSCFRISLATEKLWRSFLLAREAPPACPPSQETRMTSWHQPDAACCGMFTHCLIPDSIKILFFSADQGLGLVHLMHYLAWKFTMT